MWRIEYSPVADADLLSLDKPVRERILKFFRERIAPHPSPKQVAEPLEGEFQGLWRFRIGDYRAVCDLQDHVLVVLVLFIDHRNRVYKRRRVPLVTTEGAPERDDTKKDSQKSLDENI